MVEKPKPEAEGVEGFLRLLDEVLEGGRCKRMVRLLVAYMNITEEARRLMEGWSCTIQFALTGEEPFHVKIADGRATLHAGLAENPQLVIQADSELMHRVLSGSLDLDEAATWFTVRGAVADALRFRRVSEAAIKPHLPALAVLRRLMP